MTALGVTENWVEKGEWLGLEAVLGPGACAKYHFPRPSPQSTLDCDVCRIQTCVAKSETQV